MRYLPGVDARRAVLGRPAEVAPAPRLLNGQVIGRQPTVRGVQAVSASGFCAYPANEQKRFPAVLPAAAAGFPNGMSR
jgi:hypothetical protein